MYGIPADGLASTGTFNTGGVCSMTEFHGADAGSMLAFVNDEFSGMNVHVR